VPVFADSSMHGSRSCRTQDEQLQGLLQATDTGLGCSSTSGSCGAVASAGANAGAVCGSESVASLVQRWEKLEHAWQRSWWV
jgi:hypothetical protein